MATWRKGRARLRERLKAASLPLEMFKTDVEKRHCSRVPGTAVFMAGDPRGTPLALLHNLKHNSVLHERNIILTVITSEEARVDEAQRLQLEKLGGDFFRITAHYGFMERPNVPELMRRCAGLGLKFELGRTTFFLSSETIVPGKMPGMPRWQARLFAVLARNAQRATAFFGLPPNRVVELGMQVEI